VRPIQWLRHIVRGSQKQSREQVIRILAIALGAADQATLTAIASNAGWELTLTNTCEEAIPLLLAQQYPIIACDRDLPGTSWQQSIQQLAAAAPASRVFLASSVMDDYLWQEVIHQGGYDVLVKPFQQAPVIHTIDHAFWTSNARLTP
jgi:DNA-binding NtrC family response regulator